VLFYCVYCYCSHHQLDLYGEAVTPTWNKTREEEEKEDYVELSSASSKTGSSDKGKRSETSKMETQMFAVVACLNLTTWTFHSPLVQFPISSGW
jgi:hypothetical protein